MSKRILTDINEKFFVTKARKYDRGEIVYEEN